MKIVRITFLSCLAAVWIVACGQDTAEPPSPDPVDSWYNEDDIDNYHHWPFVVAVWKVLGKNPLKATKAELARVTRLPRIWRGPFIPQRGIDLLAACVNLVELDIAFIRVSNEQLAVLGGLTKLESLTLLGDSISDLSPLAGLVNLRHLDLTGNQIEDLSPLAGLVDLPHLDLSSNEPTASGSHWQPD
jgi:Leucine-rich repeat (LRR) protein